MILCSKYFECKFHKTTLIYFCFKSDVSFWRELKRQGNKFPGTSDNTIAASSSTINTARKFLAEIYNVSIEGIPEPMYAMMSLWDSYPYGAGWYHYKAGYDWNKVCIWASLRENLFLGSPTKCDSTQSTWLQRLARKSKFCLNMVLSKQRITKVLIRLRGCAGWSAPVLFANPQRLVFSRRGPYV